MHKWLLTASMAALTLSLGWLGCGDGAANPGSANNAQGGSGGGPVTGRGVGEPCWEETNCRPGLTCSEGSCQPGHDLAEGEECVISAECLDGLYCASGLCSPAGAGQQGDSCAGDSDCGSGFRCVLTGLGGECQPEGDVDVGGVCDSTQDCFGGLACLEGVCAVPPPGSPPFGIPWSGVDCPQDDGPVRALFRVPRGTPDDGDFFSLPYPNDVRFEAGQLDLSGFPTPGDGLLGYDLVQRYVDAVESERDGWGMYQAVLFRFSGTIDFNTLDTRVKLVDLTSGSGMSYSWSYFSGRSTYICQSRLAVTRATGQVFEPGHQYAAYLLTGVKDTGGQSVMRPDDLAALLDDTAPADADVAAHWAKYQPLRQHLADSAIDAFNVLNATVFTIGNPRALVEQLQPLIDGLGPAQTSDWTLCDSGVTSPCPDASGDRACPAADPAFHELHALVQLPVFQQGAAPYLDPSDGGDLKSAGGAPTVDHLEPVCLSLTVPTTAMPAGGWPTLVFAHGTGGSFRSHVLSGLAAELAQGIDDGQGTTVAAATLGIDQVMHGPRRGGSTKSPNDLFFNFANPKAALGNPQQAAADQMALLRLVPSLSFDAASSPTGESFNLASSVAFWGHSQGAMAGTIAAAYGDWAGVVLSGASASLKDALVSKTSPLNIAALVPFVLGDADSEGKLVHGNRHPATNLMQHFIDGGDPVAYARLVSHRPPIGVASRHLFQPYGLDDTYTPSAVQKTHLLGAYLGLAEHDGSVITAEDLGLTLLPVPVSGNLTVDAKVVTAVGREYAPAAGSDGHFVVFDVPSARADALRFVAGALGGVVPQVGP